MKKTTSYFEDEAYAKMDEMAKQDKRSFTQILGLVVERGLNSTETSSEKGSITSRLPEDIRSDIEEFARSDERTDDQMMLQLLRQAIKEKRRLREKYLKSLNAK